jgi:hypothetical protein
MGRMDGKSASYDWFIEQYKLPYKERAELFISVSAEDLDEAAIKFAKAIGQEEKVLKHISSLLNRGTSRAMALRKKFKNG